MAAFWQQLNPLLRTLANSWKGVEHSNNLKPEVASPLDFLMIPYDRHDRRCLLAQQ